MSMNKKTMVGILGISAHLIAVYLFLPLNEVKNPEPENLHSIHKPEPDQPQQIGPKFVHKPLQNSELPGVVKTDLYTLFPKGVIAEHENVMEQGSYTNPAGNVTVEVFERAKREVINHPVLGQVIEITYSDGEKLYEPADETLLLKK